VSLSSSPPLPDIIGTCVYVCVCSCVCVSSFVCACARMCVLVEARDRFVGDRLNPLSQTYAAFWLMYVFVCAYHTDVLSAEDSFCGYHESFNLSHQGGGEGVEEMGGGFLSRFTLTF